MIKLIKVALMLQAFLITSRISRVGIKPAITQSPPILAFSETISLPNALKIGNEGS